MITKETIFSSELEVMEVVLRMRPDCILQATVGQIVHCRQRTQGREDFLEKAGAPVVSAADEMELLGMETGKG